MPLSMPSTTWIAASFADAGFSFPRRSDNPRGCRATLFLLCSDDPCGEPYRHMGCRYAEASTTKETAMAKQLRFNSQARSTIRQGVDTLANAVRVTIGPRGRNVVLDHPLETPKVLNDG